MWDNYPFFFWRNKQTHTHIQGRGKEVLTERHTTTSLKSYGDIYIYIYLYIAGVDPQRRLGPMPPKLF